MKRNKEAVYYYAIALVLCVYFFLISKYGVDPVTKPIATGLALISAVTFWLQFKRTQRLNESNYIMNFNNQFIANKDMCHIEHVLELYFNNYEAIQSQGDTVDPEQVRSIRLNLDLSRNSEECQMLINYLVYLEALAALVEQQVVHIGVVDDLFSYRFFLAVNNPVVQDWELLPYREYYRGVFRLSERWVRDHEKRHIHIPMYQYRLTQENLHALEEERPITRVEVSIARSGDNKRRIAECVYDTDSYIYPEAFGDYRDRASKAIGKLIGMNGFLLDYKNIVVARYNGQICGICVISDGTEEWNVDLIKKRLGSEYLQEQLIEGLSHAAKYYFKKIGKNMPENTIEIAICCVSEGYRRKHVASKMLRYIIDSPEYRNKSIRLSVLEENASAIGLYEKMGFVTIEKGVPGYAAEGLKGPKVRVMEIKR